MSVDIQANNPPTISNPNRVPSAQFINIQSLLSSKNKKSIGQGVKLYDTSPKNDSTSGINNSSSKATILTTCHDEFEPIPDDQTVQGLTLDKVLGGTFRQIDLTNMKDFSSELFPSRPTIPYVRSKTYTKRRDQEDIGSAIMEEPKESNSFHVKETRDDDMLKDSIGEHKEGASYYFNKSLISTVKSGAKDSQQSLVLDKRDSGLEDSFQKSPSPSSQKKFLQQLRIKKRVYENLSNSPPVNSNEKSAKAKKKKVSKLGISDFVNMSQIRSIDCSVERKKSKPLNEFIKKAEADLKDLSFGVEGKSIDCTPTKRLTHKNSTLIPNHDKRPSLYKIGMEDCLSIKGNQNQKVLEVLRKTGVAFNDTQKLERHEQYDLYQKYSTKFGIKPQEYFGSNSVLESKLISIKHNKGKSPSPMLTKKGGYVDIDLYKSRVPGIQNKNIFKESSGRAAL